MNLYVLKNGQVLGPFTDADVRRQLSAGTITPADSFAIEGDSSWKPIGELPPAGPAIPRASLAVPPPSAYRADPHLAPPSASTSNLAIAALVTGILGLFCGLSSIAAVVLGHMALTELRRHPNMGGRGMALTGLILGYIILAISLVAVIAGIFFGAFAQMHYFTPFPVVPGH